MAGSAISLTIASMFAGGFLHNETMPNPIGAAAGPSFDIGDECHFWEPTRGRFADADCEYRLIGPRYGRPVDHRYAIERAQRCALRSGDSCIMSHEIDLDVPSALVWDKEQSSMRLLAFPRILEAHGERRVVIRRSVDELAATKQSGNDASDETTLTSSSEIPRGDPLITYTLNRTIHVEHTDMSTGRFVREILEDDDAFCVQLLYRSMPIGCFDE